MKNIERYIIIWCMSVSFVLLAYSGGGEIMSVAEWVAIGIALLGVAGGIWAQIVQFKKDAQRIDGVNKTSVDIKNDTTKMKPLVCSTDENVREIRDGFLVRKNQIDTAMEGIASLVKEQQFNEYIKQRVSGAAVSPEYIINAVRSVYERIAELEKENAELINDNTLLVSQNRELQLKNDNLIADNKRLKNRLNEKNREI